MASDQSTKSLRIDQTTFVVGVVSLIGLFSSVTLILLMSLSGKKVLTSHSHRGFSPVITTNRIEEPFQRFLLGRLVAGSDKLQRCYSKRVYPQRSKPLKRFTGFDSAQVTGLKPPVWMRSQ
jgi:hypothetical protein